MDSTGVRTVLLAVLAAGLLAGLAAGIFHYVATEPVIEQAIALESAAATDADHEPPVVSRDVQRVGLIVGWALYGVCVGLAFGAVYALTRPRFGHAGAALNAFASALVAYWLIGLFPFLKYPANPPGVGDPETIGYRQALFVLFWVLSVGGLLAAAWVHRLVRARTSPTIGWAVVGVVYLVYAGALFGLMPPNPDPVELPAGLVSAFRGLSLVGLTLFWLVLGAAFGLLLSRAPAQPSRPAS
jgi:hypothetical protein